MKKLILVFIISTSAFAASGFEIAINIPIFVSIGIPMGNSGTNRMVDGGINSGITAQLGYGLYLENSIGVSILGEVGYSYNEFSYSLPDSPHTSIIYDQFHSLQLGLLPKLNIKNISIGLGGGVKIPFSATQMTYNEYSSSHREKIYYDLNFNDIKRIYDKMNVIPYIKLTLDFYTPEFDSETGKFSDTVDGGIGLYLGYDFGPKTKYNVGTDGFNIGAQFSARFKPSDN